MGTVGAEPLSMFHCAVEIAKLDVVMHIKQAISGLRSPWTKPNDSSHATPSMILLIHRASWFWHGGDVVFSRAFGLWGKRCIKVASGARRRPWTICGWRFRPWYLGDGLLALDILMVVVTHHTPESLLLLFVWVTLSNNIPLGRSFDNDSQCSDMLKKLERLLLVGKIYPDRMIWRGIHIVCLPERGNQKRRRKREKKNTIDGRKVCKRQRAWNMTN